MYLEYCCIDFYLSFQVMATDVDSYPNAVITYSIIDGNAGSPFLISPQDGTIQVASLLDREKVCTMKPLNCSHVNYGDIL
jgi:hypothetical protein